jgi:hypothetical protein
MLEFWVSPTDDVFKDALVHTASGAAITLLAIEFIQLNPPSQLPLSRLLEPFLKSTSAVDGNGSCPKA